MKRTIAFILSLMTVLSVLATGLALEVTAADEMEFVVPNIIPAKGIEDYLGEWMFYLIIEPDGRKYTPENMQADGEVDDRANVTITEDALLLYTPSAGEIDPLKHEFIAEDGSLKVINEQIGDTAIFFLTDNGMLMFFSPEGDAGESSVYLARKEDGKTTQE